MRLAVVGATGNVGREMLSILSERLFPADEVFAIASRRSIGIELSYGDKTLKCHDIDQFDFSKIDICLMSVEAEISKLWSPRIANMGSFVIDNSSAWRMDLEVPLIIPEVNADSLLLAKKKRIIANPNCSTIQLAVALKPLHDYAKIKRVVVATYQSVSGSGKDAMDELWNQTKAIYVNDDITPHYFPKQIAFNVIPHIDRFMEDGMTREEWKMKAEIKKILDPSILLTAHCVRVPTFVGHSEAVNIEFETPLSAEKAQEILEVSPGLILTNRQEDGGYTTPIDCVGEFAVFVSRIREDTTIENGLDLWVTSDNLRKGAALNAVQIAELLLNRNLIGN